MFPAQHSAVPFPEAQVTVLTTAHVMRTAHRDTRAGRLSDALRTQTVALVVSALDMIPVKAANEGQVVATTVRLVTELLTGEPTPPPVDTLGQDVTDEMRAFYGAACALRESIDESEDVGSVVDFALADRPRGLDDMVTMLLVALGDYERVSARVGKAAIAWGDESLKGPALKAECIAELMLPHAEHNPHGQAVSRSRAEGMVTGHPRYAAHKERLDECARGKHDAETAADVAKVRVDTLREVSKAMRKSVTERMFGGSKQTPNDRAAV